MLFNNVLLLLSFFLLPSTDIVWPLDEETDELMVPENAQDLIDRLLTINPSDRLGSKRGAAEIKGHPFFEGIDWDTLYRQPPPFVPSPNQDYFEGKNASPYFAKQSTLKSSSCNSSQ
jgi:serine/threonine protein kinase